MKRKTVAVIAVILVILMLVSAILPVVMMAEGLDAAPVNTGSTTPIGLIITVAVVCIAVIAFLVITSIRKKK